MSRVCANGRSKGRALCDVTTCAEELPIPSTKRPGAASASAAALIARRPGPRVCTGKQAQPRRRLGAHCEASTSGVKPSTSCASLVQTSV